jgi:hypothetical protein
MLQLQYLLKHRFLLLRSPPDPKCKDEVVPVHCTMKAYGGVDA